MNAKWYRRFLTALVIILISSIVPASVMAQKTSMPTATSLTQLPSSGQLVIPWGVTFVVPAELNGVQVTVWQGMGDSNVDPIVSMANDLGKKRDGGLAKNPSILWGDKQAEKREACTMQFGNTGVTLTTGMKLGNAGCYSIVEYNATGKFTSAFGNAQTQPAKAATPTVQPTKAPEVTVQPKATVQPTATKWVEPEFPYNTSKLEVAGQIGEWDYVEVTFEGTTKNVLKGFDLNEFGGDDSLCNRTGEGVQPDYVHIGEVVSSRGEKCKVVIEWSLKQGATTILAGTYALEPDPAGNSEWFYIPMAVSGLNDNVRVVGTAYYLPRGWNAHAMAWFYAVDRDARDGTSSYVGLSPTDDYVISEIARLTGQPAEVLASGQITATAIVTTTGQVTSTPTPDPVLEGKGKLVKGQEMLADAQAKQGEELTKLAKALTPTPTPMPSVGNPAPVVPAVPSPFVRWLTTNWWWLGLIVLAIILISWLIRRPRRKG